MPGVALLFPSKMLIEILGIIFSYFACIRLAAVAQLLLIAIFKYACKYSW